MSRWVFLVAVVLIGACGQERGSNGLPNARAKMVPLELGGRQTQVPCPPQNDALRVSGTMEERILQLRCYGRDATRSRRRS